MNIQRPEHRVVTDAKYCADGPFFWTEVVFRSRSEIQTLIRGLQDLLKSHARDAHFHISDAHLTKDGPAASAEIIFYGPKRHLTKDQGDDRVKTIKFAEILLQCGKHYIV